MIAIKTTTMVIGMMMLIMMTKVAMIMIIEGETTEDKFP